VLLNIYIYDLLFGIISKNDLDLSVFVLMIFHDIRYLLLLLLLLLLLPAKFTALY